MHENDEQRTARRALSTEDWEQLRFDLERSIRATGETLARTEALLLAAALLHAHPIGPSSRIDWGPSSPPVRRASRERVP